MTDMKILEDYIVPVIRVTRQGDETKLEQFYGTAFFINDQGVFLSASHVMRAVEHDVSEKGSELALVMRKPGDKLSVYQGKVSAFSFADDPFDIAVQAFRYQPVGVEL